MARIYFFRLLELVGFALPALLPTIVTRVALVGLYFMAHLMGGPGKYKRWKASHMV